MFSPTFVDIGIFIGTIGFFFVLFLLYARSFPVIAQAEVKTILKASSDKYKRLRAEHGDDVDHYSPIVREPASNVSVGIHKTVEETSGDDEIENDDHHNPTVNADALGVTEVEKDRLDEMLERIGTYDPAAQDSDDLTRLKSVGPLMQQHLHQVGIYTYSQVSRMKNEDFQLLNEVIDNFPKETERADWAAQAKKLNK